MVGRRGFLRILAASMVSALALLFYIPSRYKANINRRRGSFTDLDLEGEIVYLPFPKLKGTISIEEVLANRRSIRDYVASPLTLDELSQILWSAYGITETTYGFKTTPSAGATYPLDVYVVVGPRGVKRGETYLKPGSYKYNPHAHVIRLVKEGDLVGALYEAALEQEWVLNAPVNLVFTAVYERTTNRYGERGVRYVWIEVGHAGQNVYLQATGMGLATVAIGAFYDEEVREIIGASEAEHPLYIMPVARPLKVYRLNPRDLEDYIMQRRE